MFWIRDHWMRCLPLNSPFARKQQERSGSLEPFYYTDVPLCVFSTLLSAHDQYFVCVFGTECTKSHHEVDCFLFQLELLLV